MADILIQGKDRPSGWRPVGVAVLAAAAVLAILLARHFPDHRVPAHHPAPVASSGPVQLAGLGSVAAALLNYGSGGQHACTPHAQVSAVTAPRLTQSRLRRACAAAPG